MHIEAQKLRVARIETPKDVDPEQAAKLASLGYIGSTAAPSDAKDLPDPKDKAETVRAMRMSFHLLNDEKKPAEAAAAFRALLKTEPKMADVWNGLAQAYRRLGRNEEALAALKETARLAPAGSTDHYLSIATLALELGKLAEARTHAELALKGGNPLAHEALASIALVAKDYAAAAKEIAEAKRENPQRRLPRLIAARILAKQGRLEEALREADAALAIAAERKLKPLTSERTVRGDILARLGREKEAEESFLDEIRLYPEDFEAYQNLALLYASQGRARDVYATIERMMSATPGAPSTLAAAKVLDLVGDRDGAKELRKRAGKVSRTS
jgi:tetratricopeptide (TPR) repeat protein